MPKTPRRPRNPTASLRRRAEVLWRVQRRDKRLAGMDLDRVVHELEVHQIELELQNEELRRAQGELEQSRDQLTELYDFAPIGYVTLDPKRTIVQANLRAASLLGVERMHLIGKAFHRFVAPESQDILHLIQQAEVSDAVENRELVLRRADGKEFPVSMEIVSMEEGGMRLWRCAFSDITERRRFEDERRDEARRKDQFLSLLGHELRNPLAAISFATEMLSSEVTEDRRIYLEDAIGRQVKLLRRLVDELIDLARITHGQIVLQKERVDLTEFLQSVAGTARSFIVERGQELAVRLPPEEAVFMADGMRLEQVAMNLLSNASKYTGKGGSIELSGAREGKDIVIRCKDSGQGILTENKERIFEPFVRGREAGLGYGEASLGIGLTLVKQLVDLHGGSVEVESEGPGKGSEFTVRLPIGRVPPAPQVERKPAPGLKARRPASVLIVEDNPDIAQTLTMALEQAGHQVTHFESGPAVLSELSGLNPDAALIDIGLPGMDGYELAARLRQSRRLQRARFIAISGFRRRAKEGLPEAIFERHLIKPIQIGDLLSLLDESPRTKTMESASGILQERKASRPQKRR